MIMVYHYVIDNTCTGPVTVPAARSSIQKFDSDCDVIIMLKT